MWSCWFSGKNYFQGSFFWLKVISMTFGAAVYWVKKWWGWGCGVCVCAEFKNRNNFYVLNSWPSNLHEDKMITKIINLDVENAQSMHLSQNVLFCYVKCTISYPEDYTFIWHSNFHKNKFKEDNSIYNNIHVWNAFWD